jgi:hypothetical protein
MAVVLSHDSRSITADTYKEDSSVMHDMPIMVTSDGVTQIKWSLKELTLEEAEQYRQRDAG